MPRRRGAVTSRRNKFNIVYLLVSFANTCTNNSISKRNNILIQEDQTYCVGFFRLIGVYFIFISYKKDIPFCGFHFLFTVIVVLLRRLGGNLDVVWP